MTSNQWWGLVIGFFIVFAVGAMIIVGNILTRREAEKQERHSPAFERASAAIDAAYWRAMTELDKLAEERHSRGG